MGANAQTSVPAFTSGQVLTAAQMTQVNTGIPVFASSTERDAAFGGTGEKTLAEGQMAYLEDVNETQYYDGSSWAVVGGGGGLVFISRTTIGSAVSSVTVSGAFSSDYDNYRILITGGSTSATQSVVRMTMGAAATGHYYVFVYGEQAGTGADLARGSNLAYWPFWGGDTNGMSVGIDLYGPFITGRTSYNGGSTTQNTSSTSRQGHLSGFLNDATSYTDFDIAISTGTMTGGTIDVYGYAKA